MKWSPTEKYPEGKKYIGQWKNDKSEGDGQMIWHGVGDLIGEFKNDLPNGYCEQTFLNGAKYKGEVVNGKRQGEGTLTLANGETYTGEWKNDVQDGYGKMIYADGAKYEGENIDFLKHIASKVTKIE